MATQIPGNSEQDQSNPERIELSHTGYIISLVLIVLIIGGGIGSFLYLKNAAPHDPKRGQREFALPVQTQKAALGPNTSQMIFYGEIVSAQSVDMRATAAGEIIQVNPKVQIGARIFKDGLLVKIDPFEYEGAKIEAEANLAEGKIKLAEIKSNLALEKANLDNANAQLSIAKKDFIRAQKLKKKGSLDQRQLDNRQLTLSQRAQTVSQRESAIEVTKARLEQQKSAIKRLQWRLEQAERNLKNTVMRAPFTGVIQNEIAEVGRRLNANEVVITMYEPQSLDVRFTMSNQQFGRLSERGLQGRKAVVTWNVAPTPLQYGAVVERTGAEVKAANGGVEVFARITGNNLDKLRPGTFVEVVVDGVIYENTIRVPETAVYENKYLYIAQDDYMVKREITVVDADQEFLIIKGDIKSGDIIIRNRIAQAGEGVKVIDVNNPKVKTRERRLQKEKQAGQANSSSHDDQADSHNDQIDESKQTGEHVKKVKQDDS